ncbi:MAG: NAD(P)/FAD-dependent oxidoreductase [Candidatus Hydrothermarchaeales archaeon]
MTDQPRVIIVGGGFGGLTAARELAKGKADVLLIDRNNYHTFLPLLYQVAAAEIEPETIGFPLRAVFRKSSNIHFSMAEVKKIDLEKRMVLAEDREFPYDYMILAVGSSSNFFGIPGASEHAYPLKTLEHGITLRNHVLRCFERAEKEDNKSKREELLTFVIVGGGATGVEFAGALSELVCESFVKDFSTIDFQEARIMLLEAMDRLLPDLPDKLGDYAFRRLGDMGVKVLLGSKVSEITHDGVYLDDESFIPTNTVVWTAGVQGNPLAARIGLPTRPNGQADVQSTLQIEGHPEVYVIGDLAYFEQDKKPLPLLAPVAVQEGRWAAKNIKKQIIGENPLPFKYRDRGTLVTLGRNSAAAQIIGRSFTGFFAWLLWLGIHLFNLIGFQNRLFVLIDWAWDYVLYDRTVRLILPDEEPGDAFK